MKTKSASFKIADDRMKSNGISKGNRVKTTEMTSDYLVLSTTDPLICVIKMKYDGSLHCGFIKTTICRSVIVFVMTFTDCLNPIYTGNHDIDYIGVVDFT